jgi:hypothetical protein
MNNSLSHGMILCMVFVTVILMILPVSAVIPSAGPAAQTSSGPTIAEKTMVNARISPVTPSVGDPVTISGVATGSNLTAGLQIWIFAGNYVNVSTVSVNADGTYSGTYATAGFPPATYYVFVQAPGNDGIFNIGLTQSGTYSGQVVNAQTGAPLFTFTGTGSVHDAEASVALSNALNNNSMDDVYSKTSFQLVAPVTSTAAATPAEVTVTSIPSPAATAKSPLSPLTVLAGTMIAGVAGILFVRR